MSTPKTFNIPNVQKILLGIALAFWAIYKLVLKDPAIVKDLGSAYGAYLSLWLMVTLACAGLSGWQFALFIWDMVKDKIKDKVKKVEERE
jgi:ABC-type uncharacterized transport system permease subunit